MKVLLLALAAAILAPSMRGEPGAVLQVDYSNPHLIPAKWTLVLRPGGAAHFHSERGDMKSSEIHSIEPATIDRDLRLGGDFTARVFDTMARQNLNHGCESHLKVAFQGTKKFTYSGPEGEEEKCEFNYSKNRDIQTLGDQFIAVASTIIEGARLELLLQHDPLGLDHEMEFLLEGSRDGRLQQLCAIRGILQKVQDDPSVMEHVRKQAGILLAQSSK